MPTRPPPRCRPQRTSAAPLHPLHVTLSAAALLAVCPPSSFPPTRPPATLPHTHATHPPCTTKTPEAWKPSALQEGKRGVKP
eukprot:135902-Chlamydomonas_euryale.AAC.3